MDKEKLIEAGKKLKEIAKADYKVKSKMDSIIRANGTKASKATLDEIIQCCLLTGIECQELIDLLGADERERTKAILVFLSGYTA